MEKHSVEKWLKMYRLKLRIFSKILIKIIIFYLRKNNYRNTYKFIKHEFNYLITSFDIIFSKLGIKNIYVKNIFFIITSASTISSTVFV